MIASPVASETPYAALTVVVEGIVSETPEKIPDHMWRMASEVCQAVRRTNRRSEEEFRAWMISGTIGKVLLDTMTPYLKGIEPMVQRFRIIREKLGSVDLYSKIPDARALFIAEFNSFVEEANAYYQLVKDMVDLAAAPRLPPDPAQIEAARQAFERGETRAARPGFLTGRPT
jgi:hypothetical protein